MVYHEQLPWEGKTPEEVLKDIADDVLDYTNWYTENGDHLPKDFKNDYNGWVTVLKDIEFAFELIVRGQDVSENKTQAAMKRKGIELFYQYMSHLWR